jgi:hypothetical protein
MKKMPTEFLAQELGAEELEDVSGGAAGGSWIQSMAAALGQRADAQAASIIQAAAGLGSGGGMSPSDLLILSAQASIFALAVNAAGSSIASASEGTKSLARG